MKIHLPLSIRRFLLACITSTAGVCICGTSAMAESQNLTFSGSDLTWNTLAENAAFVTGDGASAPFTQGDNVSFTNKATVSLEENISAGTIKIESEADVIILQDNYTLEAERIELAGTLDAGDTLHIDNGTTLAVVSAPAVLNSNLVLGNGGTLASGAAANLNGNTLALYGGSELQLTASGDGKAYTLFTGVSRVANANGNTVILTPTDNAISNYFDINQPGTGFWAEATLVYANGELQLVRHDEIVKDAVRISERKTNGEDYQYYAGIAFENISSSSDGGAVYGISGSTFSLNYNGCVTFFDNAASAGGAIYGVTSSTILLRGNVSVTFSGNIASSFGGAIYGAGSVELSNNGSVVFSGNTSSSRGGAIYEAFSSAFSLNSNGSVTFSGNSVFNSNISPGASGGAIAGGDITINDNGAISFLDNSVTATYTESHSNGSARGGAIAAQSGNVTMNGNGTISFRNNSATASVEYGTATGGAIYADDDITMRDNQSVEFVSNSVFSPYHTALGGAIESWGKLVMTNNGSVRFKDNSAWVAETIYPSACGGAIWHGSDEIFLSDNEHVEFIGNRATRGGAIETQANLSIRNNGSVLFEKNTELYGGAYRLRSIYSTGSGFSLSCAEGQSIEFRDSIYVNERCTPCELNATYTDSNNSTHTQQGDIIFTGKYTETHLNEILEAGNAGRKASKDEIRNSRTSEVYTMTNLYGGRLRVEDGAIYQGQGITVHEGSNATVLVKNATLSHSGCDLIFNASTTLELYGTNTITGNLKMMADSTLYIDFTSNENASSLNDSTIYLTGDTNLLLSGAGNGNGKTYTLFTGVSGVKDAQGNAITLDSTNNAISNYFDTAQPGTGFWANATLVYANGELQLTRHNETVKEALKITSRQTNSLDYSHFAGIESVNNSLTATTTSVYGGASHVDGGTISLCNNGSVSYANNSTSSDSSTLWAYGGAISGDRSTIYLNGNGKVDFSDNSATVAGDGSGHGGAIYAGTYSILELNNNGNVTFSGNAASSYGGAIYGDSYSNIKLKNNGSVTFSDNSVEGFYGGAIYGYINTISINNNGSVSFSNNSTTRDGGAIEGHGSKISLNGNSEVNFGDNSADRGGAIYGGWNSSTTLSNNSSITFAGNTATEGGAIHGCDGTISLDNNGSVVFRGNSANGTFATGGAVYGGIDSTISLKANSSITFSGNTATHGGGAICGNEYSSINLNNNGSITFAGNSATDGGAIFGFSSTISLNNNGSVTFAGNSATDGGGIHGYDNSTILLSGNVSVTFTGNKASSYGGAIYGDSGSTIKLNNNDNVTFSSNTAAQPYRGDAIYGSRNSTISLCENGSVAFSDNLQPYTGCAIYTTGGLNIRHNDYVLFERNGSGQQLRSIYAEGSRCTVSLSAPENKSIEFRDSVYIGSGVIVSLNEDYTDDEGKEHNQAGDIIFTGATTVADLYEVNGNVAGTKTAILASRATEVYTMTNLYGGRLRVEDGAVYKGNGITAHVDSAATVRVKDAELSHAGYNLEFNAGTALEVAGNSTIRGNVNLKEGSLFKLEQAASLSLHETVEADAATLTVNGGALLEGSATLNASLTLADGATLDMDVLDAGAVTLNGALTFAGKVCMGTQLQDILSEMRGWEESITLFTGLTNLVLPGTVSEDATGRVWVGDVFSNMEGHTQYYFNYSPDVGSLAVVYIPEPATSTLSLLALTALATRRKRK